MHFLRGQLDPWTRPRKEGGCEGSRGWGDLLSSWRFWGGGWRGEWMPWLPWRVKGKETYEPWGKIGFWKVNPNWEGDLRNQPVCNGREQIVRNKIILKHHWNMKQGRSSFFFFEWLKFLKAEWQIRGYCQIPNLSHHTVLSHAVEALWILTVSIFLSWPSAFAFLWSFFLITWASKNEYVQNSIKLYFPHTHHCDNAWSQDWKLIEKILPKIPHLLKTL